MKKLKFNVEDKVFSKNHGLCQVFACAGDKFIGQVDANKILKGKDYIIGKIPFKEEDLFSVYEDEITLPLSNL